MRRQRPFISGHQAPTARMPRHRRQQGPTFHGRIATAVDGRIYRRPSHAFERHDARAGHSARRAPPASFLSRSAGHARRRALMRPLPAQHLDGAHYIRRQVSQFRPSLEASPRARSSLRTASLSMRATGATLKARTFHSAMYRFYALVGPASATGQSRAARKRLMPMIDMKRSMESCR